MDNTQLFLPKAAVRQLGLEPNMDDKGDETKTLWFGRVWELRALIAVRYSEKMAQMNCQPLSEERKAQLDAVIRDPVKGKLLDRMAARWRGAAFRLRSGLSVLEKLQFCGLRGTLVYCHGSGGNSWDNMRICRMIAKLGVLVVVPDGFAYPKDTAMGKMRHKDLQPLKKATDKVDYWAGDLMYCSDASGEMCYSTQAEGVLADPNHFRELYERCYQLRRSELHMVIERLPHFIKVQGIYMGGTSEGAMTIARFDDQKYGSMILGRFINSFSIEYCYFTPKPEDGKLGGQLDVPTLNIIGTKDQYFGAVDSVSKIVVSDTKTGYGDKVLDGNGFPCMVEQQVSCGLVCIFEDGVHSPCNTHDNFLHPLFDVFFRRPRDIWRLDKVWGWEPMLKNLFSVTESQIKPTSRVLKVFCPKMKFPQSMSFRRVQEMHKIKGFEQKMKALKDAEDKALEEMHKQNAAMLDQVRTQVDQGKEGPAAEKPQEVKHSYYDNADMDAKSKCFYTSPDGIVSNDAPIKAPAEPTLMDNTQLFLPKAAVRQLGLEPNMDDKGDETKTLWFGRVWELRALIAVRYSEKMAQMNCQPLSEERKAQLDAVIRDPVKGKLLDRMAARWRGAAFRLRSGLSVLEKLQFCGLRGTLVYCHGSGGNSWDNMRICRMIAKLGVLVVVPDGFAYPKDTAMGKMRHKDLQPLKKATDKVDYWAGDLMYCSDASGEMCYSTQAEGVLADPNHFRELYERCYQLRRSELHMVIERLPHFIKVQGIYMGGTSEGAMTIARFDDQKYGSMILGRFINSFSIEYCYFTPKPEDGKLGGQLDVPTLNIIGTKDQYFGAVDSVSKIVVSDTKTGYGDKVLDGNGFPCMVEQQVSCGLVCIFEDGVHSPCNTHDNFLHPLFDVFFRRPRDIWRLDKVWGWEPMLKDLYRVSDSQISPASKVLKLFCHKMKYPQKLSFRRIQELSKIKGHEGQMKALKDAEDRALAEMHKENAAMLDGVRTQLEQQKSETTTKKIVKKVNFYEGADKKAKALAGTDVPPPPAPVDCIFKQEMDEWWQAHRENLRSRITERDFIQGEDDEKMANCLVKFMDRGISSARWMAKADPRLKPVADRDDYVEVYAAKLGARTDVPTDNLWNLKCRAEKCIEDGIKMSASNPTLQSFLRTILENKECLSWSQGSFGPTVFTAQFLGTYANAMLSGPLYEHAERHWGRSYFSGPRPLECGIFYIDPAVEYPLHYHQELEAYFILAGETRFVWEIEGKLVTMDRKQGEWHFNYPNTPHAITTPHRTPHLSLWFREGGPGQKANNMFGPKWIGCADGLHMMDEHDIDGVPDAKDIANDDNTMIGSLGCAGGSVFLKDTDKFLRTLTPAQFDYLKNDPNCMGSIDSLLTPERYKDLPKAS